MLLDVRIYICRPGSINKPLDLYEKMGKEPQTKHLGQPLRYKVRDRQPQSVHAYLGL